MKQSENCMNLYYGSEQVVERPIPNYGNSSNDYGLGFYLTPDYEMARLWASRYPNGGYATTYSLNLTDLNVLHLGHESEKEVLAWLALLCSHRFSYSAMGKNEERIEWLIRNFLPSIEPYDVIVGYRADDAYFRYSRGFIEGDISLETLSEAMKVGRLGMQHVLKSEKAFSSIRYVDSARVPHDNSYALFRSAASDEYHRLERKERVDNTFIRDLMRRYP